MMTYLRTLVLVGCVAAAAACSGDNGVKEPDGGGMVCKGNADCTESGKAVCDLDGTKVCVQCTPTMDSACLKDSKTPVCGGTTCRGCTSHSECPESDTCLPDGSCALPAAVVYLSPGGVNGPCTKTAPCGKGMDAVDEIKADRPYLRVSGTIADGDMVINNKVVTLLGDETAVLNGSGGRVILDIKDDMPAMLATLVKVFDVQVVNADNAGVKVDDGATLELHRSKVLNSKFEGVLVASGNALIEQSEVSGTIQMDRYGIQLNVGELKLSRSKVADNRGGGIFITSGRKFDIVNSFIVHNMVNGGLSAEQPGADSVFAFNTLAKNENPGTGLADAGGIYCDDPAFTFANNIIYGNTGGNGGFLQTVGGCKFDGSYVSPNNVADTADLKFKDATASDYHLTAASPAIVKNVATATCPGLVDYDGDSRPLGGNCELGADEIKE
ncbi:MAG: right-handed parallel beta-helix repeat-containing protein [Kofleriaceae bacterium]